MQMHISEGVIRVEDRNESVSIDIFPRRSASHGMTRVELDGAGLDPLRFVFEDEGDALRAQRWVWNGDTSGALGLAHSVMREIDDVLEELAAQASPESRLQQLWCGWLRDHFPVTSISPTP